MKRIVFTSLTVVLIAGAVALSGTQKLARNELQVDVEERNPWTHLKAQ